MTTPEKYPATVDGLIEVLTRIKQACGGNTFIQINDFSSNSGCVSGFISVCLDNDMGNNEAIVLLETNSEENRYPSQFEFYTQGKEI